jgi:hypothetical protein
MSLGWKFMLPLAIAYIVITAGAVLVLDMLGVPRGVAAFGISPYWAILGVLNLALAALVFVILDRGRIVSPAYSRIPAERLARLRTVRVRPALTPHEGD